jgi:hypothetical protein
MTDTTEHPAGPAAGWYPDPAGHPVLRWWDGTRWTEQTQAPPPPAGVAPVAKPRKKRRIFLWVFLAIQVIFIIWLVTGLTSAAHNITPHTIADCQAHANYGFGSLKSCVDSNRAASEVGTGIGTALVIVFWAIVDIILGVTYGIYKLARR